MSPERLVAFVKIFPMKTQHFKLARSLRKSEQTLCLPCNCLKEEGKEVGREHKQSTVANVKLP